MGDVVEIDDVYAKAQTDKALLVVIEDEEHWIPKSHITEDSEVYEYRPGMIMERGKLVITAWIAKEKGLQ